MYESINYIFFPVSTCCSEVLVRTFSIYQLNYHRGRERERDSVCVRACVPALLRIKEHTAFFLVLFAIFRAEF